MYFPSQPVNQSWPKEGITGFVFMPKFLKQGPATYQSQPLIVFLYTAFAASLIKTHKLLIAGLFHFGNLSL